MQVVVVEEAEAAVGAGEAGDDDAGAWSSRRNRAAVACSQGGRRTRQGRGPRWEVLCGWLGLQFEEVGIDWMDGSGGMDPKRECR